MVMDEIKWNEVFSQKFEKLPSLCKIIKTAKIA